MEIQNKTPRVNLTKGATVNLTKDLKDNTEGLDVVYFGAKWGTVGSGNKNWFSRLLSVFDPYPEDEAVDLDASFLLYDKNKRLIETVYFGRLHSSDGAIHHSGDDRRGSSKMKDSDNETLTLKFKEISSRPCYIVAILNSYSHHAFAQIPWVKLRIYTGEEPNKPEEILCEYNIGNTAKTGDNQAIVCGYFYRDGNHWSFKADGTMTAERTIDEMAHGSARRVLP